MVPGEFRTQAVKSGDRRNPVWEDPATATCRFEVNVEGMEDDHLKMQLEVFDEGEQRLTLAPASTKMLCSCPLVLLFSSP